MANEKTIILATNDGFGAYSHDRQRAIYLESAMACLANPDEVWEDPTLNTAKWIYIKEERSVGFSTLSLRAAVAPCLIYVARSETDLCRRQR